MIPALPQLLSLSQNSAQNSHLVQLFHRFRLQLIKELRVGLLHQFVPVDPVGLVQVDLQQVRGDFQALAGAEENALGGEGEGGGGVGGRGGGEGGWVDERCTVMRDTAAGGFQRTPLTVATVQKRQREEQASSPGGFSAGSWLCAALQGKY